MNFTIEELCRSDIAIRLGIDNSPSPQIMARLQRLIVEVLQPVRDKWNAPIIVNSGYRCPALNKAAGGVPNSQHLSGMAADLRVIPVNGQSQKEANKSLFFLIKNMILSGEIKVGQLLDEKNYSWIHVSLPDKKLINDIRHL